MKRFVILIASIFLCSSLAVFAAFSPYVSLQGGLTETFQDGRSWTSLEGGGTLSPLLFRFGHVGLGVFLDGSYQASSIVKEDLLLPPRIKLSTGPEVVLQWGRFFLPLAFHMGFQYFPTLYGATMYLGASASPSLLLTNHLVMGTTVNLDLSRVGNAITTSVALRIQGDAL